MPSTPVYIQIERDFLFAKPTQQLVSSGEIRSGGWRRKRKAAAADGPRREVRPRAGEYFGEGRKTGGRVC